MKIDQPGDSAAVTYRDLLMPRSLEVTHNHLWVWATWTHHPQKMARLESPGRYELLVCFHLGGASYGLQPTQKPGDEADSRSIVGCSPQGRLHVDRAWKSDLVFPLVSWGAHGDAMCFSFCVLNNPLLKLYFWRGTQVWPWSCMIRGSYKELKLACTVARYCFGWALCCLPVNYNAIYLESKVSCVASTT